MGLKKGGDYKMANSLYLKDRTSMGFKKINENISLGDTSNKDGTPVMVDLYLDEISNIVYQLDEENKRYREAYLKEGNYAKYNNWKELA